MTHRSSKHGRLTAFLCLALAALLFTGTVWFLSDSPKEFWDAMDRVSGALEGSSSPSSSGKGPGPASSGGLAPEDPLPEGSTRVHIIDVGQALCVLIQGPEKNVLIDGGENDTAQATAAYLREQGVEELDWVFNTHPHYDHFGGLRNIMKEIPAREYITPGLPQDMVPTVVSYEKLLDYLAESGTPVKKAKAGTAYELGGDAVLTVLAPVKKYDDLNNWSIVLRLDCGETSFLITGDIENKAERDILESGAELKSDVLVLPHHGSSTSILRDFVQEVDPRYGVISCGKGNDYGHPHKETLELYEKLATQLLRTDESGTVVFETDGISLEYYTYLPDAA